MNISCNKLLSTLLRQVQGLVCRIESTNWVGRHATTQHLGVKTPVIRAKATAREGRDRGAQTHSQQSHYCHGKWLGAVRCIRGILFCIRNAPTDSTALRHAGPIKCEKNRFFLMPGSRDQACLLYCRRTAEFCGQAPRRRALTRHPLPPDILTRQRTACLSGNLSRV